MNRNIINIYDGVQTSDGAGVKLRRIIGGPDLNMLDPFLLNTQITDLVYHIH